MMKAHDRNSQLTARHESMIYWINERARRKKNSNTQRLKIVEVIEEFLSSKQSVWWVSPQINQVPEFLKSLNSNRRHFRSPNNIKNRLMKFNSKTQVDDNFLRTAKICFMLSKLKRRQNIQKKNEIKYCAVGYFALTQLLIYADKIYYLRDLGWKL